MSAFKRFTMSVMTCLTLGIAFPASGHANGTGIGSGVPPQNLRLYDLDGRVLVVDDREILSLIGLHEAEHNYDIVTMRTRMRPPAPLTQMTIQEVIDFQRQVVRAGSNSSAMGMYQIIRNTLLELVQKTGVSTSEKFDRYMQDRLARFALGDCGFYRHDVTDTAIGNCIARVWASMPVVSGPNRGKSHYENYNGNKALTSPETVMAAIQGRFKDATPVRLAEITSRAQGSLTINGQQAPQQLTHGAMAAAFGLSPEQAAYVEAAARQNGILPGQQYAQHNLPGHAPTNIRGPAPAGYVAAPQYNSYAAVPMYQPQPQTRHMSAAELAEIERRREANRILYGEQGGIVAERVASQ